MDRPFTVETETAFYGRTSWEYRRMLDLGRSDLDGVRVLDCPGGPGSFVAVASALAEAAVAVDPRYGPSPARLERAVEATIERFEPRLRERRDEFVWDLYGDVDTRFRAVRAAADRFAVDYAHSPERYVAAALPDLPFSTDAFDPVCSANFLFLYDDRFDRAFHERALCEFARVAREEVRVFPLATLAAERSTYVDPVVATLREEGLAVESRAVPYEFLPGVSETLVVSDVAGYEPA